MRVSEKELQLELKRSNEQNKATSRLHELFYTLAKNLVRSYYIPQHALSYQDAIIEGYMEMVSKFRAFDLSRDNAFAYFTQMCKNCFIQLAVKQKRYARYLQKLYMVNNEFFIKSETELELDLYLASKKVKRKI